jgi:hypothetical protein
MMLKLSGNFEHDVDMKVLFFKIAHMLNYGLVKNCIIEKN